VKIVAFTLPDDYAADMTSNALTFYLDVFGAVRDSDTHRKIGDWDFEEACTTLPLDDRPWVVHSFDYGPTRFASEQDCWLGYRACFEPRDGFSQNREDYPA
jgi:hypothetical protein